tara:strand:- start:1355 stop:1543 length:189 start_codon:yes stop_codon:yes gene_type:complete
MHLSEKELLYLYKVLVEKREKLEETDGLKVLTLTLDNRKELDVVNTILARIIELKTLEIGAK